MANSEADLKGARCLGYVQARMWSDIFKYFLFPAFRFERQLYDVISFLGTTLSSHPCWPRPPLKGNYSYL